MAILLIGAACPFVACIMHRAGVARNVADTFTR